MFTAVSPVLTENLTACSHSLYSCSSLPRQRLLSPYHCLQHSQQRTTMANPLKRMASDDGPDYLREQQGYGNQNYIRAPYKIGLPPPLPPPQPLQLPSRPMLQAYSPEEESLPSFLNSPPPMQPQLQSPMVAQDFLYHEAPPIVPQPQMPQANSPGQPYLIQQIPQPPPPVYPYQHHQQLRPQSDYADSTLTRRNNPIDVNYPGFIKSAYGEPFGTSPAYISIESMIPPIEAAASISPVEQQLTMGSASSRNSSIASIASHASTDYHKRLSLPLDYQPMSYYPSAPFQVPPIPPQPSPITSTGYPPGSSTMATGLEAALKQSKRKSRAKAGTGARQRSKYTSPSYLLDKRPPDQNGFVNYDHQDGKIIMSAVAPSGNCRRKNNKKRLSVSDISKKFNSVQK
ncbi:hypothetical protein TRVA0_001S10594 [Trichomonascus vanleenenianus]|uniref:uncharacterized protein n=1 Tax=Trichomonascus vanleenenianus TaxID=2268995 RepID=UPI003ECAB3CB